MLFSVTFPLAAIADTDYYKEFLYEKGYLEEGADNSCYKLKSTDIKSEHEADWRRNTSQMAPQLVGNASGGVVIAWSEGDSRVYLQAIDGAGKSPWGPIAVSKGIAGQDHHRIVSDGVGGVLVVWQERRYDCGSQGDYVVVQRFDGRGRGQWGPKGVTIAGGAGGAFPDIVADGKGGSIVVWYQRRDWSGDHAVFVQRIDGAGKTLWAPQGVAVDFSRALTKVYGGPIATDAGGGAVIVAGGVMGNVAAAAQRIAGDGKNRWGGALGISAGNTNSPDPQLISDGGGGAFISLTPDRRKLVAVMHMDGDGKVLWDVTLAQGSYQELSRIVSDGSGGTIVVWRSGETDGIYLAQRVDAKGKIQWKENVVLGKAFGARDWPSIVADESGGVIAVWRSFQAVRGKGWTNEKDISLQDIYVQRVSAAGKLAWNSARPVVVNIGKTPVDSVPTLVPDGKGGAIVVWIDGRRGLNIAPLAEEDEGPESGDPQVVGDIYAQRLTASGETAWADNGVDISSRARGSAACLSHSSKDGVVAGLAVNMRERPNTSAEVLLSLNRGAEVKVLERKTPCETIAGREGRWTRVRVPSASGREGWIFDSYVVFSPAQSK